MNIFFNGSDSLLYNMMWLMNGLIQCRSQVNSYWPTWCPYTPKWSCYAICIFFSLVFTATVQTELSFSKLWRYLSKRKQKLWQMCIYVWLGSWRQDTHTHTINRTLTFESAAEFQQSQKTYGRKLLNRMSVRHFSTIHWFDHYSPGQCFFRHWSSKKLLK